MSMHRHSNTHLHFPLKLLVLNLSVWLDLHKVFSGFFHFISLQLLQFSKVLLPVIYTKRGGRGRRGKGEEEGWRGAQDERSVESGMDLGSLPPASIDLYIHICICIPTAYSVILLGYTVHPHMYMHTYSLQCDSTRIYCTSTYVYAYLQPTVCGTTRVYCTSTYVYAYLQPTVWYY